LTSVNYNDWSFPNSSNHTFVIWRFRFYPFSVCASRQGRSTLWNAKAAEELIELADSGAKAVLSEWALVVGFEDVEGEAAEAGKDNGIDADAGAVLGHGDVAAIVRGVLDLRVIADSGGGAGGWDTVLAR
jgi:hypothetical protein